MDQFEPDLVIFEPAALHYPLGEKLKRRFESRGTEIRYTQSHNRVTGIPGDTDAQQYRNAKRTLVVGVRKGLEFDTSKPSAEYAIPLTTGCAGHCHYCYLQTTMGTKPYVRVYANIEEILKKAKMYIDERAPELTRFEAACTGDPVSLEHMTGALAACIRFMANEPFGRLRFVTKFANVDSLLGLAHRNHTRVRFSVNADYVIRHFEPATSSFRQRIEAAGKIAEAGYPLGFLIAPIIAFDGWQEAYAALLRELSERLKGVHIADMTFELIQHRFTKAAKNVIIRRYPKSRLDMNEDNRQIKWGRYGRFKYVYRKETQHEMKSLFESQIPRYFPQARIEYFV